MFEEHKDKAIVLHIKQLFHCPNKSLDDVMGQNRPKGAIKATATNTLSGFFILAEKQAIIIAMKSIVPVKRPIIPVSAAS